MAGQCVGWLLTLLRSGRETWLGGGNDEDIESDCSMRGGCGRVFLVESVGGALKGHLDITVCFSLMIAWDNPGAMLSGR